VNPDPEQSGTWSGAIERRRPHPAPLARRLLMLAIILGVLAGFTLLVWLAVDVRKLTQKAGLPDSGDLERAVLLFRVLAYVMAVSLLGVAAWIGHFAWRVRRAEVYPPPGSRHMRVKRVLRDAEAHRVATVCFTIAGLLTLCALVLVPLVYRLLYVLGLLTG
jgi:hypothetical protein